MEKENLKLIEAITELEAELKTDKQKIKTMESSVSKDRDNVLEQLNNTAEQVEIQSKKYLDLQTMLKEARDDIIKLEEENARLKDQVRTTKFSNVITYGPTQAISKWVDAAESDFDCMFQVSSDIIGITNAIHIMEDEDEESDTNTIVDDDKTECDILIDDLDDIVDLPSDPS